MTSWFRSWHGAVMDPKYLMIAQEAKVKPIVVAGTMWALMDCASQAEERGNIEKFCFKTFAAFMCVSSDEVQTVLEVLSSNGIISDNRLTAWEKRQPKREDKSTERVKQHREKKRLETQRNAPVTRCNAPDTDTDTDTERKTTRANEFDSWWVIYPNKVGKADAKRAFDTARKSVSFEALFHGVEKYIREKPPDRQWCNPGTWLRQERWLDEPGVISKPNGRIGWGETLQGMIDDENREAEMGDAADVFVTDQTAERR